MVPRQPPVAFLEFSHLVSVEGLKWLKMYLHSRAQSPHEGDLTGGS